MACRALHCGRSLDGRVGLLGFGVATGAVAMHGLLIRQCDHGRTRLMLHLRYRRHQLRRFASTSMTTTASGHTCGRRILLEKVGGQDRRPVGWPRSLERRMLLEFGCRLGGVMTFYTGDRAGAVNTIFPAIVTYMIESHSA